jgi:trehalose 6-phosphate synthase
MDSAQPTHGSRGGGDPARPGPDGARGGRRPVEAVPAGAQPAPAGDAPGRRPLPKAEPAPRSKALMPAARLVVLSNRLPVRRVRRHGHAEWERSSGGLVSALVPALEDSGGTWIGWSGAAGRAPEPFEHDGIRYGVVPLSAQEVDAFYHGFANRTLWPLYHDGVRTPEFHRAWWGPYCDVNRRFAEACAAQTGARDVAWVQDYHLQLVPAFLRALRPRARIGFFLHIPFPPVELFGHLPWRRELLEGLLGADVVGFQTREGAQNFLRCVRRYTTARVVGDSIHHGERTIRADAFPISIDFARHDALSRAEEVRSRVGRLKKRLGGRRILLGVDRLDYTKGIDVRFKAFEGLLERRADVAARIAFIQIAVPSRESVGDYAEMRGHIEQTVGRINGEHGEPGLVPIQYMYRSVSPEVLSAYYAAADVMVVTPLRDGMNLVAKEFVASRGDEGGVLVLSEFAGAARELRTALLVNPYDVDGTIAEIERALDMSAEEAGRRMRVLRRVVEVHDVHRWSASFLEALRA